MAVEGGAATSAVLNIRVYENGKLLFSTEVTGPVELGRQQPGERGHLLKYGEGGSGISRVVIAELRDPGVSRRHVLLEPLSDKRARIRNLSALLPVVLADGTQVAAGGSSEVALPHQLSLGGRIVHVEGPQPEPPLLAGLEQRTTAPGAMPLTALGTQRIDVSSDKGTDPEALLGWLRTVMGVLQSAATSKDFFQLAARAAVEVAGLDSGAVLLYQDGGWSLRTFYSCEGSSEQGEWSPSQYVLKHVHEERRTVWQKPQPAGKVSDSLAQVQAVVAAPILDRDGGVIGAIYGDRRSSAGSGRPAKLTKLEAMLVELVASGVAAGLARLDQEQAALAARVLFEQFFTPELAQQLESDPDLLSGKDTEVSILVVDIRGFSRISERLGPRRTFDWIRDMMTALSDCVFRHQGVLVDYVGDELMAMWGAPREQPDHPELACLAALDMLSDLPRLDQKWSPALGEFLEIGIGINTGTARVGNVGSERKFKYGPLGNTVNLASRVQGATKYLKCKLLITGATRARLGDGVHPRRLCTARVVNIGEPVQLFELSPPDQTGALGIQQEYERALGEFEAGRFRQASQILGKLLSHYPNDGPSLVLMARAINCLVTEPKPFDPVWTLPGK